LPNSAKTPVQYSPKSQKLTVKSITVDEHRTVLKATLQTLVYIC